MDNDDWLMILLQEIQLENFYSQLTQQLQITRPSHFDYVQQEDLEGIGLSKPAIRRLLDAVKKLQKKKSLLFKIFPSTKPPPPTSPPSTEHDVVKCLINLQDLHFVSTIGSGSFGVVRKAIWMTSPTHKIPVAVKVLRSSEGWEFAREVNLMHCIQHPHLITLHGVVLDNPPLMVTELARLGSLLDYLRKQQLLINIIHLFLYQICSGMLYLESLSLVHRDLAARNILLSSPTHVKIGDFGLTRSLQNEDVYVTDEKQRMPFAWCAIESLHSRIFSHKSDVWMVGVVAWEMFSGGREPWTGLNGAQVIYELEQGHRLQKPELCSSKIYDGVLQRCWQQQPQLRPSFKQLLDLLSLSKPREVVVRVEKGEEIGALVIETSCDNMKVQLKSTGEVRELPSHWVLRSKRKDKRVEISEPLKDTLLHTGHSDGVAVVWGNPAFIDSNVLARRASQNDILPIPTNKDLKRRVSGRSNSNHRQTTTKKHTSKETSEQTKRNSFKVSSNHPFTRSSTILPPRPISDAPPSRSKGFFNKGSFHSSTQNLSSVTPLNDGYLLPDETKEIIRSRRIEALALFDSSIEPSLPLPPPTAPVPTPLNFSEAYKPLSNSTQSSTQSEPIKVDYAKLSELFNDVDLNSPSILTPNTDNTNNSPPLVSIVEAYKSPLIKDSSTTKLKRLSKHPTLNISPQNKKISNLVFQKSPPVITESKSSKKTVLSPKNLEKLKNSDVYCNEEEIIELQHKINNGKNHDSDKHKNGRTRQNSKTNEDLLNGKIRRGSKNSDQLTKTPISSKNKPSNNHNTMNSNGKKKDRHKTGEEYKNHTEFSHSTFHKTNQTNREPSQKSIQDLLTEMGGFVTKEQVENTLKNNHNNYIESLKQLKEDTLYNMGLVSLDRCKCILAFHHYDLSSAIRSITNSSSV